MGVLLSRHAGNTEAQVRRAKRYSSYAGELIAAPQAEAVTHASRDALEAAMMDPTAWPRFMPLVEAVESESGSDADGGVVWRLHFRAPDGTAAATTVRVRPYGRLLLDPALPWTTVQWTVEGHDDRGSSPENPLFSWELRPRFEGVWVTFGS